MSDFDEMMKDEIVLARYGAMQEKLAMWLTLLRDQVASGKFDLAKEDPAALARNLMQGITRSGDGRIHSLSLTR